MHCHLLPGVDDGVRTFEDALKGIAVQKSLGFTGAIVTPHIFPEVFDNDEAMLQDKFDTFAEQVRQVHPDFQVGLAAEYYAHDTILHRIEQGDEKLLTFGGDKRLLLIEFPQRVAEDTLTLTTRYCRHGGFTAVLAHWERYAFAATPQGEAWAEAARNKGVLLQFNLGSLAGQFGSKLRNVARQYLKAGHIDLVATDYHRGRGFEQHIKTMCQVANNNTFLNHELTQHDLSKSPNI